MTIKSLFVAFRADASIEIGSGHIMRCLTLADALTSSANAHCLFICREHEGNLITLVENKGYQVMRLKSYNTESKGNLTHSSWLGASEKEDANACRTILKALNIDWLIVDHYALDINWEKRLKPYYKKLFVIDDLADREHDADILLDQNFGRSSCDYQELIPKHCQLLIGPEYALLRPEFSQWREYSINRRQDIQAPKRWLVNLGGVDKDNITSDILYTLSRCSLTPDTKITVVMGASAPHIDNIKKLAKTMPWSCDVQVNISNMAEIMANSDIAVGAAGSTSWERCCLGLPTIMLILAENQYIIANTLHKAGVAYLIDLDTEGMFEKLAHSIMTNQGMLSEQSRQSSAITQGLGYMSTIEAMRDLS